MKTLDLKYINDLKKFMDAHQMNFDVTVQFSEHKEDLLDFMNNRSKSKSFIDELYFLESKCGYHPSQIYNRAGLSKEVYYGFYHRREYIPKRLTLLALAIGLHLYIDDTKKLFLSCGYYFPSTDEERVVEFFMLRDLYVENRNNIYDDLAIVNALLDSMHLKLLGTKNREN